MAKVKRKAVLELPVDYGNVSIGKKTIRLTTKTSRKSLTLTQADKQLCDCRLSGIILSRAGDGASEQGSLPGAEGNDIELEGVYDVKKISFDKDGISFGLTFVKKGVDKEALSQVSGTSGMLIVFSIDDIPDEERKASKNEEEDDDDDKAE